ncbi:unnamed protein product [Symbiodinium pilosum]|uniref:Uncharacterized protein n=1 Tax=Symbiodinium pilosum TaxID=2952 RepID=A0A812QMM5_SYMPI|nr:unnamed protein product [Symbiodinium pilosum]
MQITRRRMDNIFRAVGCPCVSFSPAVGVCTGVQASAATKEQKDEGWEDMECDLPDVPAPQDSDEECEPTTKAEFQKWRSTFRNNVELAAEILQDRSVQQQLRMIHVTTRHVAGEYYDAIQTQKEGQAAQLQWSAARCSGSWLKTVQRTLSMLHQAETLEELGVAAWHNPEPASPDESWVLEETVFLNKTWRVLTELASARCWSQAMYSVCLPFTLAPLFGPQETRQPAMDFMRTLDGALAAAHRIMKNKPGSPQAAAVTALLKDVWWHTTQIALETIQTARNASFDARNRELRCLAFSCFAGPSNTKFTAEDVFAHLAHVAARSQKGMLRMSKCLGFFY